MARRVAHSFRTRTAATALIVLACWAIVLLALPLADLRAGATLFGLPLRPALALPVALPAIVLAMLWFAVHQNRDDERFRDDD